MAKNMTVSHQAIEKLFSEFKSTPLLIPDYQRPYDWNEDNIEQLINDVRDFSEDWTPDSGLFYFIGNVVVFENDDKQIEVIDGQQRLTSLFLLLRAIFAWLENRPNQTKRDINLMIKMEDLLWECSDDEAKRDRAHLHSDVVSDSTKEVIRNILETGTASENAKDHYSKNYLACVKALAQMAGEDTENVYKFRRALLEGVTCTVFNADNQETALTIFSTLNDRGLPLTEIDIFKAKLYKRQPDAQKKTFTERWQDIADQAEDLGTNMQQLFQQHLFYDRSRTNTRDSKIGGLRVWYSRNDYERLYQPELLDELETILDFLRVLKHESLEGQPWSEHPEIRKVLDVLSCYPNNEWRHPALAYYLEHSQAPQFPKIYLRFLKKLAKELTVHYMVKGHRAPSKAELFALYDSIHKTYDPSFSLSPIDKEKLDSEIAIPNKNTAKLILSWLETSKQTGFLQDHWEVEHILPKKWQPNYFPKEKEETVKALIEHIGNKIPLAKELNIKASNGFFAEKKKQYQKSTFELANELANLNQDTWTIEDIIARDQQIQKTMYQLFDEWDYESSRIPTEDNQNGNQDKSKNVSPFRFSYVKLKPGVEIVLDGHPDIIAIVADDRSIYYKNKKTSLSALAQELLKANHPLQGPLYWRYDGETLADRRTRLGIG